MNKIIDNNFILVMDDYIAIKNMEINNDFFLLGIECMDEVVSFLKFYDGNTCIIPEIQFLLDNGYINKSNYKKNLILDTDNNIKTIYQNNNDIFNVITKFYEERDIPFKAFIELTHNCNYKCIHCYMGELINDSGVEESNISIDILKNRLLELIDFGVFEIVFTGGEVTLRNDFYDIVEFVSSLPILVTFLTNGSILDIDKLCKILDMSPNQKNITFQVSMYGMEHAYKKVTSTSNFNLVFENILKLNKLNVNVICAIVPMTNNIVEVTELIDILEHNNISYNVSTVIYPTIDSNKKPITYNLSQDELQLLIDKYDVNLEPSMCTAKSGRLRIDGFGNVSSCEMFRDFTYGNINVSSINEILSSNERSDWQTTFQSMVDNSKCKKCKKSEYCTKCHGMNYLYSREQMPFPKQCQNAEVLEKLINGK